MNVITVPTSTTNMTGLRISTTGLSFLKESTSAWLRISRSNRPRDSATPWASVGGGDWVAVMVIRRTVHG